MFTNQKYIDYFNKIAVFFKPDSANYWNTITTCQINEKPVVLDRYYLDFESKYYYPGEFDSHGIPLYRYKESKPFYHPIVICQFALGIYQKYYLKNNEVKYKKEFLPQADWLINNFEYHNQHGGWLIRYDVPDYHLKSPWMSAMAQGEAISVLVRAHQINPKSDYLEIANQALKIFNYNVENGGLKSEFKSYPIYEEYPSPIRTVGVLNGFIFSLFGLLDLYLYTKDSLSKKLFDQGMESIRNILKYYDLGFWSQYYLFDYPRTFPASFTYHLLAVEQLKALYIITEENHLKEYSDRWFRQSKNIYYKLRALANKITRANKLN